MEGFLLGVDGGASKTRCLIAQTGGTTVSAGYGGCANKNITSWDAAMLQVRLSVQQALVEGGLLATAIKAAHYGLGGVSTVACQQQWQDALADLTPNATITIENDVFLPIYATDQIFGIGVVSGSGGNIGALTKDAAFHLNGNVNFNSSQLGRKALQVVALDLYETKGQLPFTQALFRLGEMDKEMVRQAVQINSNELAQTISPFVIQLYQARDPKAQEIVLAWLDPIKEDLVNFQTTYSLTGLPLCFGGSTFASIAQLLKAHMKGLGEILVAQNPLAEGAIKMARRKIS